MVQRVNVSVLCDLDEGPATSTTLSFDGDACEIDLCAKHMEGLSEYLAEYFEAGRRTSRRRAPRRAAAEPARTTSLVIDREQREAIRQWAQANGYQVGNRGRIAGEVVSAYQAATGR